VSKNCLLINPWIYDFAAYDLWIQPIGLLKLSSVLKQKNHNVSFLNCLDRYDKELLALLNKKKPKSNKYNCGKFYKHEISKPEKLKHIPRKYYRYGLPYEIVLKKLEKIKKENYPDVIFITSGMTYWYPAIIDIVTLCREYFGITPIVLGGIYPYLMEQHIKENIDVDFLFTNQNNFSIKDIDLSSKEILFAEQDRKLLSNNNVYVLQTSFGCPFNCSYCASKKICKSFFQKSPEKVFNEIYFSIKKYGVTDFVFYDDALLVNKDTHIKLILQKCLKEKINVNFHTPNGLHAKFIDTEVAELMYKCNFKTIRLSLETSSSALQKQTGNKVSNNDIECAIKCLKKAGYKGSEIECYLMIGLPGQKEEQLYEDIMYAHNLGIKVYLAAYSPIPGTEQYSSLVKEGVVSRADDPLLYNNTIFIYNLGYNINSIRKIRNMVSELNLKLS
jgi:radical SAM superfamily enzyme YgiQ (UPF0313 family)